MRASSWTPTNGPNACSTRPGCARVRLGTSDDLALGPLPDVLAAFRLAHPEVELDISIGVTSELPSCWTTTRWT